MNYYEILELDIGCSQSEIKKSYRQLAKTHHPDRGGDEEKFKKLNEAYSVLSNEQTRADYDMEIYYNIRNLDVYEVYNITLEESYFGTEKKIRINGKIIDVNIPRGTQSGVTIMYENAGNTYGSQTGNLFLKFYIVQDDEVKQIDVLDLETIIDVSYIDVIKSKQIPIKLWGNEICKITLPKGMSSKERIRIPQKGMSARTSMIKGDLYVKLNIKFPNYDEMENTHKAMIDELERIF